MQFNKRAQSENGGSDKYLKLADGENINVVFRGEVCSFWAKWGDKGEVTKDTPGAKLRYRVNVAVPDGATFKMKIWEFGAPVYDRMSDIQTFDGEITKLKINIKRQGIEKNTKYFLNAYKEALAPAQMARIEKLDLYILDGNSVNPEMPPQEFAPPSAFDDASELPF